MKRYLAIILVVVAMGLSGCAAVQAFLSSPAVDFICNPTAEQQADAAKMLVAIDTAQAVGAIFYPAAGIAQASAILTVIKNGGCFVVAQLKEAFIAVDAANAAVVQAQAKKLKGISTTLPEYPALRKLVK